MTTLVATEEFPYNVTVTPKASTPTVIKSGKMANGVQVVSRTNNTAVGIPQSIHFLVFTLLTL